MGNNRFTDLAWGAGVMDVMIIQPMLTLDMNKEDLLNPDKMSRIFQSAMDLKEFVHTGNLGLASFDRTPLNFTGCGGILKAVSVGEMRRRNRDGLFSPFLTIPDSATALICSNLDCHVKFILKLPDYLDFSLEKIRSIILHLMMKQMIPDLKTCNYVDCEQSEKIHNTPDKQLQAIQNLGLVSVLPEFLWGQTYLNQSGWYALGFVLVPGMKTLHGCDGYDQWLKFLVIKKMEQIKDFLDENALVLRGPKKKGN